MTIKKFGSNDNNLNARDLKKKKIVFTIFGDECDDLIFN